MICKTDRQLRTSTPPGQGLSNAGRSHPPESGISVPILVSLAIGGCVLQVVMSAYVSGCMVDLVFVSDVIYIMVGIGIPCQIVNKVTHEEIQAIGNTTNFTPSMSPPILRVPVSFLYQAG